jgi:hypothetical protein
MKWKYARALCITIIGIGVTNYVIGTCSGPYDPPQKYNSHRTANFNGLPDSPSARYDSSRKNITIDSLARK